MYLEAGQRMNSCILINYVMHAALYSLQIHTTFSKALRTYRLESAHISAIAYCIKLEVDISKRTSFGLKKIGLRGNTIWHEPCKVSEISQKNKARA